MTHAEYTELKKQLDRIEAKVDVASDLIAIRVVSAIGDEWRGCLTKGHAIVRKLWEKRGIKL